MVHLDAPNDLGGGAEEGREESKFSASSTDDSKSSNLVGKGNNCLAAGGLQPRDEHAQIRLYAHDLDVNY